MVDLDRLLGIPAQGEYNIDTLESLLAADIPERKYLLYPFIQEQSLNMLYAVRGIGKTYVGLSIALAVAAGKSVLGFSAPEANKVLYIDGEMSARAMQERLSGLKNGFGDYNDNGNLTIVTPDRQAIPMPNLANEQDQRNIDHALTDVKLVIVDNVSALYKCGRENEAESWGPMQSWLLNLRRRGISVLLIDHAGKNGDNRGTSKKQDILDCVIGLKRPEDYRASQGARFLIKYEKARSETGESIEDMEARLVDNGNGCLTWDAHKYQSPHEIARQQAMQEVKRLGADGLSMRKISNITGVSTSTVCNYLHKNVSNP